MHDISTEWSCGVKWQIKYICHVSNTYLQNMYQYHTTQGANFLYEVSKHDPLIKWPKWGHMSVWKIYISTFTWFIANKLCRLLTLGKIFSMQMLKLSPASYFVCNSNHLVLAKCGNNFGWVNYEPKSSIRFVGIRIYFAKT